jgi:hypothetical protein
MRRIRPSCGARPSGWWRVESRAEARCDGKLHGEIIDGRYFEVKCRSRWCGYRSGVVVIHRFNIETGERSTKLFRDPLANGKEVNTK